MGRQQPTNKKRKKKSPSPRVNELKNTERDNTAIGSTGLINNSLPYLQISLCLINYKYKKKNPVQIPFFCSHIKAYPEKCILHYFRLHSTRWERYGKGQQKLTRTGSLGRVALMTSGRLTGGRSPWRAKQRFCGRVLMRIKIEQK